MNADLPARARPVTDPAERRHVLRDLLAGIGRESAFEEWVHASPIVEVQFPDRESQEQDATSEVG